MENGLLMGGAVLENQNNNNTNVTNLDIGDNIFIWQVTNGTCPIINQQVTIANLLPITDAGEDQDICELISTLEGEDPIAGTGTWTTENGASINEPNSPTTAVENLAVGDNILVWTVISDSCPTNYDTLYIHTDNQAPVFQALPEVFEDCEYIANTPIATDNCDGVIYATTSDPTSLTEQGVYTINWIYTDGNGNESSQVQNIKIEDIINPEIKCINDTTILLDTINYPNTIYTTLGNEFDFLQATDNCIVEEIINNYNNTETIYPEQFASGTHLVNWTIIDGVSLEKSCSYEITIGIDYRDFRDCDEDGIPNYADEDHCVVVPEGFSPEGNGQNDVLIIDELELYPENKIVIFNRWGNKVYEASPYESNWDGTNMFGTTIGKDKLPVGTYFYILYLNETYKPLRGYIYLIR